MKSSTKKALKKVGIELLRAVGQILIGIIVYIICRHL